MLTAALFALATATNLLDHRVLSALFTGLATACFGTTAVLHARSPGTHRTGPTDQA